VEVCDDEDHRVRRLQNETSDCILKGKRKVPCPSLPRDLDGADIAFETVMTPAALARSFDVVAGGAEDRALERARLLALDARPEFRVLLATDAATARDDADRAIAQFARVGAVHVDVVHVVKPGGLTREIWQRLHDTLAGPLRGAVDHYLVEGGDPAAAITRFCRKGAYDVIMAPASARHTAWLPWRLSVRAALLRSSTVPVWTTGARPPESLHRREVRHVGCYLSLETGCDPHLRWASEFAQRLGASLHLLHVVPPIDDGTIAEAFASDRPLGPEDALARLGACLADGVDARTTVVVGTQRRELGRVIRAEAIDLLCISPQEALCGSRLSPALRALPCPVVCCR
jgi:nucleotide-binding universal stress UspA family protein